MELRSSNGSKAARSASTPVLGRAFATAQSWQSGSGPPSAWSVATGPLGSSAEFWTSNLNARQAYWKPRPRAGRSLKKAPIGCDDFVKRPLDAAVKVRIPAPLMARVSDQHELGSFEASRVTSEGLESPMELSEQDFHMVRCFEDRLEFPTVLLRGAPLSLTFSQMIDADFDRRRQQLRLKVCDGRLTGGFARSCSEPALPRSAAFIVHLKSQTALDTAERLLWPRFMRAVKAMGSSASMGPSLVFRR
jgi:hypothetical protein